MTTTTVEKQKRRYYRIGEQVWFLEGKSVGVVKSINLKTKDMTVYTTDEHGDRTEVTSKLWKFDKLRGKNDYRDGIIGFTTFRGSAIVPSKSSPEDAGYDVFLDFPEDFEYELDGKKVKAWNEGVLEVRLKHLTTNLLPTGVGVKVDKRFYTDWANERGSTGKLGMSLLSGIVDSGYRGEVFVDILPLVKDVVITNSYTETKITDDTIYFPYNQAVAQMIPRQSLQLRDYVMQLEDFKNDVTERGDKKLGSTDKK